MKRILRTFLITAFLIYALSCTVSLSGFCTTRGEKPIKVLDELEISEGYVLSKRSDYGTDDRNYSRADTLYVWAWSSRINPYNVAQHYIQLTLDEYVHEFYLNYDSKMTRQYSYTGSFNLSFLEKPGDWAVQIFLKSRPPKPAIFEAKDVIHISAEVKPAHALSINSSPISGLTFTLNEVNYTTPFLDVLVEGNYTVSMPLTVTIDGKVYSFAKWDDESVNPSRSINLKKDTSITAYYNLLEQPKENSTIKGTVTDNLGNPISGARVTILETQQHTNTSTEPAGHYEFAGLSPGIYTIKVEASGYESSQASVVAEPAGTYTQDFILKPMANVAPALIPSVLWQMTMGAVALFGVTTYLVLWRSRRHAGKEIEETEYRITLEDVKLEAMLQELKNLLQKGLISSGKYEAMRREMEEELTKIRSLRS